MLPNSLATLIPSRVEFSEFEVEFPKHKAGVSSTHSNELYGSEWREAVLGPWAKDGKEETTMRAFPGSVRFLFLAAAAAVVVTVFSAPCAAATLCVNPAGSSGCFQSIQSAVNHASPHDVIRVGPGTYKEGVVIGIPLSLLGAGAGESTIDATNQPNGVLIDGYSHHGLHDVVVAGFTVENALFEGILAVSATDVTISNNTVSNNDASPGLLFTGE